MKKEETKNQKTTEMQHKKEQGNEMFSQVMNHLRIKGMLISPAEAKKQFTRKSEKVKHHQIISTPIGSGKSSSPIIARLITETKNK